MAKRRILAIEQPSQAADDIGEGLFPIRAIASPNWEIILLHESSISRRKKLYNDPEERCHFLLFRSIGRWSQELDLEFQRALYERLRDFDASLPEPTPTVLTKDFFQNLEGVTYSVTLPLNLAASHDKTKKKKRKKK